MNKNLVFILAALFLSLGVLWSAQADSPFLWVRNGTDTLAGNSFNFIMAVTGTNPDGTDRPLDWWDNAKMVLRNSDTTDNNYSMYCFQGDSSTSGARFDGVCLVATYLKHGDPDHPTSLGIYTQTYPNNGGGILKKLLDLRWDQLQGGASMALGTAPVRQGFQMNYRLPVAWLDDNLGRVASWKVATDGFGKPKLNTLQIGDGNSGGGDFTIQAPQVSTGVTDGNGGNLVIQAGQGTGLGAGGCVQFATSPAGTLSSSSQNPAVKTVQICGDDILVGGVSFKKLEARIAALEAKP